MGNRKGTIRPYDWLESMNPALNSWISQNKALCWDIITPKTFVTPIVGLNNMGLNIKTFVHLL